MAVFVRVVTQRESSRTPPATARTNAKIAATRGHDAPSELFLCFDDAMVAITRATTSRFLPFVFCVNRRPGGKFQTSPRILQTGTGGGDGARVSSVICLVVSFVFIFNILLFVSSIKHDRQ